MADSTAKLRSEIMALSGVDIMLNANEFKSTYQILEELAVKWQDLTDIQQASVTELIAGKRQGNIISSLMENFDIAERALETSMNSAGSAMAEHEKWQKSLEAQILKLQAAWQGLSQAFLSSDFLKSALKGIIGLVDGLTTLIDTFGTLPTLLGALSIFGSFKGIGFFKTIEDEATLSGKRIQATFIKALSGVFQNKSFSFNTGFEAALTNDVTALQNYIAKLQAGVPAEEAFAQTMRQASTEAQHFAQTMNTATISTSEFETIARKGQITEQAASFRNAKSLINEYNGGLQNCKLTQTEFIDAVGKSNTNFAKYLSGLKGAKASFGGYVASLVGAKVATIALEAATIAMNAALTMGISALVSLAVKALDELITTSNELAEQVDEVTSKFQEQHAELQKLKGDYDTTNESSMISKYEKLSKGVDNLGRNVSLTSEEYSEYQSIVGKIAEQFPSLIQGYDSQGAAILSCKDNVNELTTAYENLIKAQNNDIFRNAGKIGKDFANAVKDAEDAGFWGQQLTENGVNVMEQTLERFQKDPEASPQLYGFRMSTDLKGIENALENAGLANFDKWSWGYIFDYENTLAKAFANAVKTNPKRVQSIIDGFRNDLEMNIKGMQSIAEATLSDAFDVSGSKYYDMTDTMQNAARQMVSGWDYNFYKKYKDNPLGIQTRVNEILDQLKTASDTQGVAIETAFNLKTQFNNGEISYGDYVSGLENAGKTIDSLEGLDEEVKTDIKLSLGLDEKGLVEEYQRLANRLADSDYFDMDYNQYHNFIDSLSSEELSILWKIIPELEETDYRETIADVKAKLERTLMLEGLGLDLNLEVESAGIEALNTAMAESVTGSGLSSESIAALKGRYAELEAQGYDLSSMFEETSHGVHLNRQEFNRLEKAYASQKLTEVNGQLGEMQSAYDQLGEDIRNCTDPVEKSKLFSDRQLLAQRISEAATLATQYEGLTSAYNDWLAAEEAGQERDMYEQIIEGFENIDDEIKRGWLDDGTIEFLELLTGRTDLASLSAKELKSVYKGLDKEIKNTSYSVRDFFTVDEDGNSTSAGVYNFLKALEELEKSDTVSSVLDKQFKNIDKIDELVERDKDNKIVKFNFDVVGGEKAIADALGISEELVQIIMRAADDAGFVVNMDGAYQQLSDLQNEAKAAADYLKEIGKTKFEFDFNTTNVKSLEAQLKEAHSILDTFKDSKTGNIDLTAKGATEAMTVVSTLQAKLDSLTAEKYGIGLTVEDEQFEEPLEKLQEYGHTIAALNQLNINPNANTTEIEKLNGELNSIAEYFAELDKETKIKLGFESDDGIEEVKKKIESGEVKIPTVLDIQTNMDKNLETLADLALLNSGLLSENQEETIRKKYSVDVEVEANEVDTSDVDEKVKGALDKDDERVKERRKHNIEIIAKTMGTKDVDDLDSKLKGLDDKTVQAIAEVLGRTDVDLLKKTMATLDPVKVQAIAEAIGKGDVEGLKTAISQLEPTQVDAIARALGYGDVSALNAAVEGMDGNTVQAIAEALGLGDVNTLQITINNMQGNTVDANVNTDGQSGKINTLQGQIDGMHGTTVDIVINTIKNTFENVVSNGAKAGKAALHNRNMTSNYSEVNGTANVNGTIGRAFNQGSWGTKNSGTALVGELGRETLVRDGRYYTIGDTGAEFIKYQKGDIIFNHKQTEELFKNGRVTSGGGRAKAFATGTAFGSGSGGGIEPEVDSKSVGSDDDKFEEVIDWIETILDRVERSIDKFDQQANNIYKSWSSRNQALISEISEINNEISLQQSAYSRYMQEANKVGLSSEWVSKVQNGAIDISAITDEDLADKISDYQEWYEKALDCQDAIEELKETEASLYAQRLEHVSKQYEGILGVVEHEKNMLDEYISQSEAQSWLVSAEYYNALAKNERENIAELENQKAAMLAEFNTAMNSGTITEGSEAWYEMVASIDEVTLAIEQSNTALLEYSQTIQELKFEQFDLLQERISSITEETEFLIDLMSSNKLFDDNGQLTDEGSATMGLHGVAYNVLMAQADQAAAEAKRLKKELAKDPYDTELEARYREMISLQQEYILAAQDEKEAIRDLVSEGIELELDALQELIDKKNEELESERDLYEYQKKVKEQTKEIASLEKQMAAYSGDTSEEARQKVQQIKVDLEAARQDLEETETDRLIESTASLLDELYLEYETILNTRLDNLDYLVEQMITEINSDASIIGDTIRETADSVGYTLTESMKTIWNEDATSTKNVITTYGDKFTQLQTTTNTALSAINTNLQNMITQLNAIAKTKVKSANTSSIAKSSSATKTTTTKTTSTTKSTSGGDGVPKVGDRVKFVSGQYYYDSQGKKPLGSHKQGEYVYITNINTKNWATHGYHISTGKKLGSGDLGWLKLNQLSGYASGKKNFPDNEFAWTQENGREFIIRPSDGAVLTPIVKGDSVLTSAASNNIWDMANSPAEFIKNNLSLGTTNVPNNPTMQNSCIQNFENIVFSMPNVKNYGELLTELQKDPKFDKLIKAMTIDQIAGKSSLAKNKSIR